MFEAFLEPVLKPSLGFCSAVLGRWGGRFQKTNTFVAEMEFKKKENRILNAVCLSCPVQYLVQVSSWKELTLFQTRVVVEALSSIYLCRAGCAVLGCVPRRLG